MKLGIITPYLKGIPYHSKFSGYERLADYTDVIEIYHTVNFRRLSKLTYPLRHLKFLSKFYLSLEAEKAALRGNLDVLHHIYGEDTFLLSGLNYFKKNKKIVATFHQPPERFIRIMPLYWRKLAKKADRIIALSPSQLDFFKRKLGEGEVSLIPHGIDIEYFKPPEKKVNDMFCLSVGDHLRDYDTLINAMKLVSSETDLNCVIISKKIKKIPSQSNIKIKANISDSELLQLYRSASFFVLPLEQATANNVLLESMACGLPIITTKLDDIVFYTQNKGCLYYNKGNEKELAEKILELEESESIRKSLGAKARQRAEELSWDEIAKRTMKVYEEAIG